MANGYVNPYSLKPVDKKDEFAGREAQLRIIEDYCLGISDPKSRYHFFIKGPACHGKTSFLNIIMENAKEARFISIDARPTKDEELDPKSFLRKIYAKIYDELNQKKMNIPAEFDPRDPKHSFEKLFNVTNIPVILFFDDCDSISSDFLKEIDEIFCTKTQGYTIVFIGANVQEKIKSLNNFMKNMKVIELSKFEPNEIKECLHKPLRNQDKIDDGTIWAIDSLTKGHPFIVKLFGHYMYRNYYSNNKKYKCINFFNSVDSKTISEMQTEFESKCSSSDFKADFEEIKKLVELTIGLSSGLEIAATNELSQMRSSRPQNPLVGGANGR